MLCVDRLNQLKHNFFSHVTMIVNTLPKKKTKKQKKKRTDEKSHNDHKNTKLESFIVSLPLWCDAFELYPAFMCKIDLNKQVSVVHIVFFFTPRLQDFPFDIFLIIALNITQLFEMYEKERHIWCSSLVCVV